jgi:hypothetical protein
MSHGLLSAIAYAISGVVYIVADIAGPTGEIAGPITSWYELVLKAGAVSSMLVITLVVLLKVLPDYHKSQKEMLNALLTVVKHCPGPKNGSHERDD